MKTTQYLEKITDLDLLMEGDIIIGTCISPYGIEYSGKWTYIESHNWLVMPRKGESIITLLIDKNLQKLFTFKNGKFRIGENTGLNIDYFNPKTEGIGQQINDYLKSLR